MKRTVKSTDSLENSLHLKSSGQLDERHEIKSSVNSKVIEKPTAPWDWIAVPVILALLVLGLVKSNLIRWA